MKRNILTVILAGAALLFSCTPEGANGLPSGFVFQERSLVSLKFEHQIGDAIITTIDDTTGIAEVKLAINHHHGNHVTQVRQLGILVIGDLRLLTRPSKAWK